MTIRPTTSEPSLAVYDNALLTANRLNDENGEAVGALYSSAGQLVPASVRQTDPTDRHRPADPERVARPSAVVGKYHHSGYDLYLDEAIFGGHVMAGWGHNITETISTAWAAEMLPNVPIVLVPWGRLWISALPRIRELLDLAGWDQRRLVMTSGDTVFGRIHVPERLIQIHPLMHERRPANPAMNVVYDKMVTRSVNAADGGAAREPVFLARPEGHRRAHPYEAEVESELVETGFQVVRGWELSVGEQIAAVDAASVLVGFSGSSLHNSVFARRGVPVMEIQDGRAQRAREYNRIGLQEPLCELREQPFMAVDGFRDGRARPAHELLEEIWSCVTPVERQLNWITRPTPAASTERMID